MKLLQTQRNYIMKILQTQKRGKKMEVKNKITLTDFLDNLEILEDYSLGATQTQEIITQSIIKHKFEDETMLKCVNYNIDIAIFDIIDKAFKIGYLHGYKHHKDNSNKAITDNTFKEPKTIDINKQLQSFIENGFYPKY